MSKYVIVRGSDFNESKPIFLQKNKIQSPNSIKDKNIPWFGKNFEGAAIFDSLRDAERWGWLSIGEPKIMSFSELGITEEIQEEKKDIQHKLF